MHDVEDEVRRKRRARLLARGGPSEYADPDLYAAVERLLRKPVEARDKDVLLVAELLGDDEEWRPKTFLRFSSHRAGGGLIVFIKRRVLLPLTRWLYEYSLENFRRQERVNRLLFACVEELALENAALRRAIADRELPPSSLP
jgi:hypothetical protein